MTSAFQEIDLGQVAAFGGETVPGSQPETKTQMAGRYARAFLEGSKYGATGSALRVGWEAFKDFWGGTAR